MSVRPFNKQNLTEKLVFAILKHDYFDSVLAPFLVTVNEHGEFSYSSKRLFCQTLADHFEDCSKGVREIVKLMDDCSDDLIVRKFSKKLITTESFFEDLSESRLKTLILPFVQNRTARCLEIMMENNFPLYYKGHKKDPVKPDPITINSEKASVIFNFIKQSAETRYSISLRHQNKEISLKSSNSIILVNEPGWIVSGENAYRLENGIDGNKIRPFFTKDHIVIPSSAEEKYYRSFITNAIKNYEVRLQGIGLEIINTDCKPVLSLEDDLEGRPVLLLTFKYGNKICQAGYNNNCWVELSSSGGDYHFRKIARDTGKEHNYGQLLCELGLISNDMTIFRLNKTDYKDNNPDEIKGLSLYNYVEWLCDNSANIESGGIELEQSFYRVKFFTGEVKVEMNFSEENDWFDIRAIVNFGGYRIPFIRLKSNLLKGIREYLLPDGQIAVLPLDWFSRYKELFIYGKTKGEEIRLGRYHFTIAHQIEGENNDSTGLKQLEIKDNLEIPGMPSGMEGILRPYQIKGFAWIYSLYKNRVGGCLADDMGLGKTVQTLTHLWKLKKESVPDAFRKESVPDSLRKESLPHTLKKTQKAEVIQLNLFDGAENKVTSTTRTSLIVMPLSLIHNWENEIKKFTPGLSTLQYTGINRGLLLRKLAQYDIVLTTYGVIRNDLELFLNYHFLYIILDESQAIKNPASKISRAVRLLKAENRLVLTGTPIENSLTDLWSQLTFANPGILGGLKFFREEFAEPIEKLQDERKKEKLRKIIEPFILRRTKAVVEKDLPSMSEKVHFCEMDAEQKRLYESKKSEIRNGILEKLSTNRKNEMRVDVLRGLMQLRLISNHPQIAGYQGIESGKFQEVIRNIENARLEGHKLLIFSQFVKHLHIYRNYFDKQKWRYSYLTGEIKESERKHIISGFQNESDNLLFLISLKAGGVGLNLTAADYVFILDPWWNPAAEQQAISRSHRIGQKRNVFSYKFITSDSIEEKILKLQQRKSLLAGDFINLNDPLKLFTDEEIIGLFE